MEKVQRRLIGISLITALLLSGGAFLLGYASAWKWMVVHGVVLTFLFVSTVTWVVRGLRQKSFWKGYLRMLGVRFALLLGYAMVIVWIFHDHRDLLFFSLVWVGLHGYVLLVSEKFLLVRWVR